MSKILQHNKGDFCIVWTPGAPVDYTDGTPPATGEGVAGKGSLCISDSNGAVYVNQGTKAQPIWIGGKLGLLADIFETVETPTFDLAAGLYDGEQVVTVSCLTPGASIFYTDDQITLPSRASTPYVGPIHLAESHVLKAFAVKEGNFIDSLINTSSYVINALLSEDGDGLQTEDGPYLIEE